MKLCSACLLGLDCRYDGKNNLDKSSDKLIEEYKKGDIIPICPEQLGGLPTPRSGSRILNGDGNHVLDNNSQIITDDNKNVTEYYIKGAHETLKIAKELGINEVILKQGSPSCGHGYTQGGAIQREKIKGDGVTTALLKRNSIEVFTEENYL